MKKTRIKLRSAKSKGRNFQVRIAFDVRKEFNLGERDVVSNPSACAGMDLILSELGKKAFPYATECKKQEAINIWGWLRQAEGNAPEGLTPLLVFSRNHSKTYAVIEWSKFLELVGGWDTEVMDGEDEKVIDDE